MRIIVNGEEHEAQESATIGGLVEQLALRAERVTIELNGEVVRRADWGRVTLAEGDRVEIVHFVGGGSLLIQGSNLATETQRHRDRNKGVGLREG